MYSLHSSQSDLSINQVIRLLCPLHLSVASLALRIKRNFSPQPPRPPWPGSFQVSNLITHPLPRAWCHPHPTSLLFLKHEQVPPSSGSLNFPRIVFQVAFSMAHSFSSSSYRQLSSYILRKILGHHPLNPLLELSLFCTNDFLLRKWVPGQQWLHVLRLGSVSRACQHTPDPQQELTEWRDHYLSRPICELTVRISPTLSFHTHLIQNDHP